jgi:hypothetical protein
LVYDAEEEKQDGRRIPEKEKKCKVVRPLIGDGS